MMKIMDSMIRRQDRKEDLEILDEAAKSIVIITGITICCLFFCSSRRRHTISTRDWSSDVCSSDLRVGWVQVGPPPGPVGDARHSDLAEDGRQATVMAVLDGATPMAVGIDDIGQPQFALGAKVQVVLQQLTQQRPAVDLQAGLQIRVRQAGRLTAGQPSDQGVEARVRGSERPVHGVGYVCFHRAPSSRRLGVEIHVRSGREPLCCLATPSNRSGHTALEALQASRTLFLSRPAPSCRTPAMARWPQRRAAGSTRRVDPRSGRAVSKPSRMRSRAREKAVSSSSCGAGVSMTIRRRYGKSPPLVSDVTYSRWRACHCAWVRPLRWMARDSAMSFWVAAMANNMTE